MKLFTFIGASGSGKTTIQHSLPIEFMTNCTTRPLRHGEIDGYHIKKIDEEEFLKLKKEGYFFETNVYAGNYYGTPKHKINELINGKPYHCTKDINGVKALRGSLGDKVVVVYIKPPSVTELRKRMIVRGDDEDDVNRRIEYLEETNEIENEKYADYVIINDDLKEAQIEAHGIVIKELLKTYNK